MNILSEMVIIDYMEKEKDNWKEVDESKAKYAIILNAGSYETSAIFFDSLEDALWAIKNSWFDPKRAILTEVLNWSVIISKKDL